ncbi:hypothetical protein LR48_Vigan404s001600 [Vigna angularis]|uniref:Putative plant transposon protein domain-containing protein n=1 Tax=Phaseolus angularis TaxID=3914 RepID=A0A0L9T977_PHAAN|nr:hypothetical protein LR48_Vigan404s001600 [Vigna angularis]
MVSSSHPSRDRGKVVVAVRNADLSGWISDEETRLEFLRWMKFKHIVPHKYLNLDLFEKGGFHFQEWIETQGLSTLVQMKGDWYPDLVRVFYNNMRNIGGVLHSRVKGVNVHIDNDVWFQLAGLKAEELFSHLRYLETNRWLKKNDVYNNWLRFPGRYSIERLYVHEGLNKEEKITTHILAWVILPARPVQVQDRMTTEDVFLLYAIKNHVTTNWVEVIKDHMIDAGTKHAQHLPYVVFISKILTLQGVDVSVEKKCSCNCSNVINRNTLTSIGLVKTTKGWCFKDEENMVQRFGSKPALNEDRTNFVPETNFERFVVEKLRRLEQKIDALHEKKNKNDYPTEDSSEESSEEDSMEIF